MTSSASEGGRRGLNVACRDSLVRPASKCAVHRDRSIGPSVHHQGGYPRLWSNRSNRSGPRHVPTKYAVGWVPTRGRELVPERPWIQESRVTPRGDTYRSPRLRAAFRGGGGVGEETTSWPPPPASSWGLVVERGSWGRRPPAGDRAAVRWTVAGRRSPDLLYILKSLEIYKMLGGTVLFF